MKGRQSTRSNELNYESNIFTNNFSVSVLSWNRSFSSRNRAAKYFGAEEGGDLIKSASDLEPDNDIYKVTHAVALRFLTAKKKRGRKQEGVRRLQQLRRRKGRLGVMARFMLIDHAIRRGDYSLMLNLSEQLKELLPNAACPLRFAGAAQLHLGNGEAAERELENALKMRPGHPEIKRELAHVRSSIHKPSDVPPRTAPS